jgi:uncharacterized iron-regulated membrane protein
VDDAARDSDSPSIAPPDARADLDPIAAEAVDVEDGSPALVDEPDEAVAVATADKGRPVRAKPRRRRRRNPVKRATIVTHRWLSFAIGLLLIVITTSGAAVLYAPEWKAWSNSGVYHPTRSTTPISMDRAVEIVNTAHPDFEAGSVNKFHGIFEVYSADDDAHPGFFAVDPGSGRITGFANPNSGVMAFMEQVHECFFTCDDYPGYVGWLNHPVPSLGMKWLSDVTWAGFLLGVSGLLLLFLAVSGIWLWWPTIKKFSHGFRVRWKKGRYARDYDLHQVVGLAAIPFLLMWAITGAGFEFNWVSTAWYSVTGGQTPPEFEAFTPNEVAKDKPKPTDIGTAAAIAVGQKAAGADATLVYLALPTADDDTTYYSMYFARDFDQYRDGPYPGQYGVDVDRYDASHFKVDDLGDAKTLSNKVYDAWGASVFHYGFAVNGWWRLVWFVFGLTPLLLAFTGVSTWLAKRAVRKRKKKAVTSAAPPGGEDERSGQARRDNVGTMDPAVSS